MQGSYHFWFLDFVFRNVVSEDFFDSCYIKMSSFPFTKESDNVQVDKFSGSRAQNKLQHVIWDDFIAEKGNLENQASAREKKSQVLHPHFLTENCAWHTPS